MRPLYVRSNGLYKGVGLRERREGGCRGLRGHRGLAGRSKENRR